MSISSPTSSRPAGGGHQDVFVVAVRRQRVFTVAITTKKDKTGRTLPIPNNVADRAGLARGTSVVVDQYDHFTWLGYDIRPVTGEPSYIAGRMPPAFLSSLLTALTAKSTAINRD